MGIRFQFEGLGLEEGLGGAQWELRRITPGDTPGCVCLDAALPGEQYWGRLLEEISELSLTILCSNTVRKSIARILTVINQKQRQNLREFYKKSKCTPIVLSFYLYPSNFCFPDLPLDLRYKKTRAIRRRLTTKESSAITEKQHKKNIHFPKRSMSCRRLGQRAKMLTISRRDRPQGLKEFFYELAGSGMHECTMILFFCIGAMGLSGAGT